MLWNAFLGGIMQSKSPRKYAGVGILLLTVLMGVSPRLALAHAVLLSSTPQKNAAVTGPDVTINLKYNSRVDGARSTLSLLKPDGTVVKIGTPEQTKQLELAFEPQPRGRLFVREILHYESDAFDQRPELGRQFGEGRACEFLDIVERRRLMLSPVHGG